MNKQIKGLLYFYLTYMRYSVLIFWAILLSILIISLVTSYLLNDSDGVMMMTLTIPIYFYIGIIGYVIVKNWLPFTIKIGATRKNIYFSIAIFFIALALVFSMIAMLIQEIITPLADQLNMTNFSFMHIGHFVNDAWYARVLIDIFISLFIFSLSFLIGLLQYRFGLVISMSLMGIVLFVSMLGVFQGWLIKFFIDIFSNLNLNLFLMIGLMTIIIYGLTWILLRRTTTISVR